MFTRQALLSEGIHWVVNPAFSDDLPIARPALGADLTDWPVAATLPPVDVAALVRAAPPTNTLLRNHLEWPGTAIRSSVLASARLRA